MAIPNTEKLLGDLEKLVGDVAGFVTGGSASGVERIVNILGELKDIVSEVPGAIGEIFDSKDEK